MPPAVAGAAIGAAGSLGGALISRTGQGKAIGASERATMAQLQYQREQDAAKQKRYDAAMQSYAQEKQRYDQIRTALLGHYGIQLPGAGGAPAGAGAPPAGGGEAGQKGMSLGDLASIGGRFNTAGAAPMPMADPSGPSVAPDGTPAEPAAPQAPGAGTDVFDWRNYGVR